MMRQRQRNAVAERANRQAVTGLEPDRTLALVAERVGIYRAKPVDQPAPAMEVDGIAFVVLEAIDAHGAAAAGLLGEIAGLAPFQRLAERSHAGGAVRGIEHQLAQRHQLRAQGGWITLEDRLNVLGCETPHPTTLVHCRSG